MCQCACFKLVFTFTSESWSLHTYTQVHIIVGIGDFMSDLVKNESGVMADVAASPNDPIFINHHTMIDCILEEWL